MPTLPDISLITAAVQTAIDQETQKGFTFDRNKNVAGYYNNFEWKGLKSKKVEEFVYDIPLQNYTEETNVPIFIVNKHMRLLNVRVEFVEDYDVVYKQNNLTDVFIDTNSGANTFEANQTAPNGTTGWLKVTRTSNNTNQKIQLYRQAWFNWKRAFRQTLTMFNPIDSGFNYFTDTQSTSGRADLNLWYIENGAYRVVKFLGDPTYDSPGFNVTTNTGGTLSDIATGKCVYFKDMYQRQPKKAEPFTALTTFKIKKSTAAASSFTTATTLFEKAIFKTSELTSANGTSPTYLIPGDKLLLTIPAVDLENKQLRVVYTVDHYADTYTFNKIITPSDLTNTVASEILTTTEGIVVESGRYLTTGTHTATLYLSNNASVASTSRLYTLPLTGNTANVAYTLPAQTTPTKAVMYAGNQLCVYSTVINAELGTMLLSIEYSKLAENRQTIVPSRPFNLKPNVATVTQIDAVPTMTLAGTAGAISSSGSGYNQRWGPNSLILFSGLAGYYKKIPRHASPIKHGGFSLSSSQNAEALGTYTGSQLGPLLTNKSEPVLVNPNYSETNFIIGPNFSASSGLALGARSVTFVFSGLYRNPDGTVMNFFGGSYGNFYTLLCRRLYTGQLYFVYGTNPSALMSAAIQFYRIMKLWKRDTFGEIAIVLDRAAAYAYVYFNGYLVESTALTGSYAYVLNSDNNTVSSSAYLTLYNAYAIFDTTTGRGNCYGYTGMQGYFKKFKIYNFALSAAQVDMEYKSNYVNHVYSPPMTDKTWNVLFFSASSGGFTGTTGVTLTGNVDGIGPSGNTTNDWLQINRTSTTGPLSLYRASSLSPAKRYRITLTVYNRTANGTIKVRIKPYQTIAVGSASVTHTVNGETIKALIFDYNEELDTTNSPIIEFLNSSDGTDFTYSADPAVNPTIYIKDVSILEWPRLDVHTSSTYTTTYNYPSVNTSAADWVGPVSSPGTDIQIQTNVDGINSENDWMSVEKLTNSGPLNFYRNACYHPQPVGAWYKLVCSIFVPNGAPALKVKAVPSSLGTESAVVSLPANTKTACTFFYNDGGTDKKGVILKILTDAGSETVPAGTKIYMKAITISYLYTDQLVLDYRFDEGIGKQLLDYSGNKFHAEISNAKTIKYQSSFVGTLDSWTGLNGVSDSATPSFTYATAPNSTTDWLRVTTNASTGGHAQVYRNLSPQKNVQYRITFDFYNTANSTIGYIKVFFSEPLGAYTSSTVVRAVPENTLTSFAYNANPALDTSLYITSPYDSEDNRCRYMFIAPCDVDGNILLNIAASKIYYVKNIRVDQVVGAADIAWHNPKRTGRYESYKLSANGRLGLHSAIIPPDVIITKIVIRNTSASGTATNVKLGTTAALASSNPDLVAAVSIVASSEVDCAIVTPLVAATAAKAVYLNVGTWNSTFVTVTIFYEKLGYATTDSSVIEV